MDIKEIIEILYSVYAQQEGLSIAVSVSEK